MESITNDGSPGPGDTRLETHKLRPEGNTNNKDRYCPECDKPAEYDSDGYSVCHGVRPDPETGEPLRKPKPDPTASFEPRSSYFGVCSVRRANGTKLGWRAQISRNKERYYIGEFESEETAVAAYDNAVWYLFLEGGFFRPGYSPRLNRPEDYANAINCPPPYFTTRRLLQRIRTGKWIKK